MLSLYIYSNFTFIDFSFEIEVTLRVETKEGRKTSWPLKAKLQIAEDKRIQMKYLNSGWQELPNNITISDIKFTDEFRSDKIKIQFKSIAGENFGKLDDAEPVDPIKIKFTTFWELDHANKPSNTGVGAVLENVGKPTWKRAEIKVQSGCKDVENCECDVKLTSLKMTSPPNQNYIVGEASKLNFDLVLENSGVESALNTRVRLMSSIINPTTNADNKPKGDGIFDVKEWKPTTTTEGNSEEKSFWEWKIAAIGKNSSKTASFKFQLNKVNFTGQESPLEKFNIQVDTCCKKPPVAVCVSKTFKEEADPALSFKHLSKVKWEKVDTDEGKQTVEFGDDSREVQFSQTFMITNKGHSPTLEKTQLKIFIPETKLVKSKNVQIENWQGEREDCTKEPSGTIPLSMNCKGAKEVISCQGTTNCQPYKCNLKPDWKKGKSYKINVPMSFSATDAEHSAYAVCVYAKVGSETLMKPWFDILEGTFFLNLSLNLKRLIKKL